MMTQLIAPPEFETKITPEKIKTSKSIGFGLHLRAKFTFILAVGVFGRGAKYPAVAQRMYSTHRFTETYRDDKGNTRQREVLDDVSARNRLDNVMKGNDKPLIQRELDFLALCFSRVFGQDAIEALDPEVLRAGTLDQVLRQLSGVKIKVNWSGADPIMVLKSLAASSPVGFEPQIVATKNLRWMDLEDGNEPDRITSETILPVKTEFVLEIDAGVAKDRPLVLNFIEDREETTADGRPVRAQLLPLPIRKEDGYGNWRISKRGRPFKMGSTPGRYGFCAISGAGLALHNIHGSENVRKPLTNTELQTIAAELLAQAATSTPALVGVSTYRLVTPDGARNLPKSRGA